MGVGTFTGHWLYPVKETNDSLWIWWVYFSGMLVMIVAGLVSQCVTKVKGLQINK